MSIALPARPGTNEYDPFYQGYIAAVPEGDIMTALRDGGRALHDALAHLPDERGGFRYAEGKWSVREVVGHMIDAERIFTYRALRIARGDATPLPGFEENDYVRMANSDERTLASLVEEQRVVRDSAVHLFGSLPAVAWLRRGTASGKVITVRALAYITAGHANHHLQILRDRYQIG